MKVEIRNNKLIGSIPDGIYELKKFSQSRSLSQNKALWLWFTMVAETLNDGGMDIRTFIREEIEIPWSKDSVHDLLWIKLQIAMTGKKSTTKINTQEINKIMDVIIREADKRSIELPPFPSFEYLNQEMQSLNYGA